MSKTVSGFMIVASLALVAIGIAVGEQARMVDGAASLGRQKLAGEKAKAERHSPGTKATVVVEGKVGIHAQVPFD